MGFTVTQLKRAYTVRQWRDIFMNNPYVAVVQMTAGRSWGRSNMRARVLGDKLHSEDVDARYAVPWAAREGAEKTRYSNLAILFRGGPCAVVFGSKLDPVLEVLERTQKKINGALLLGGRFGSDLVGWDEWERAKTLGGEEAVRAELVRVLASPPPLVRLLNQGNRGLVGALKAGGGGEKLVRVLKARADAGVEGVNEVAEDSS